MSSTDYSSLGSSLRPKDSIWLPRGSSLNLRVAIVTVTIIEQPAIANTTRVRLGYFSSEERVNFSATLRITAITEESTG